MPKRVTPAGAHEKPARTRGHPAASAETDSESGNEGSDRTKELYALDVMRERGLIGEEEYLRRKAKIAAQDT